MLVFSSKPFFCFNPLRDRNFRRAASPPLPASSSSALTLLTNDSPSEHMPVLVENGGFGAQAAAPIARMVIDYYLLGKKPDGPAKDDDVPEEEE